MKKDNYINGNVYQPADVLISKREPFDKNTLWIHVHDDIIEIKVFNKNWKTLFSSEDKGLSGLSLDQVNNIVNGYEESFNQKIMKQTGKISSNSIILLDQINNLNERVTRLENKLNI